MIRTALALALVAGCASKMAPPGSMKVGAYPAPDPAPPEIGVASQVAVEIDSGIVEPIDLLVSETLVGHCTITYDLWDDVYVVEQGGVKKSFRDRQAGLASCVNREALRRARAEALSNRSPFSLRAERHELVLQRGHDYIWCAGASDERRLRQFWW